MEPVTENGKVRTLHRERAGQRWKMLKKNKGKSDRLHWAAKEVKLKIPNSSSSWGDERLLSGSSRALIVLSLYCKFMSLFVCLFFGYILFSLRMILALLHPLCFQMYFRTHLLRWVNSQQQQQSCWDFEGFLGRINICQSRVTNP